MATYILKIPIKLPSLNDYIAYCRYNKFKGAKMKMETDSQIQWYIKQQSPNLHIDKPVKIHFIWQEKDKRRDLDNIYSAKKYILDALVKQEVLQDDSQRWVKQLSDEISYGKDYGVTVWVEEI